VADGPITGAAARAAAEAELRRREYHRNDDDIITQVLHWISRRADSVFSGTASGSATLVLLVLLVGAIALAIWRGGRPRRSAQARHRDGDPLAPDSAIDHRALAARYEADGRYADAVREWLRATVQTIEARGVLDPRPGRTGAGLAREAGAVMPSIAAELFAAVDAFDQVWFGRRPATRDDAAQAHRVADAVVKTRIHQGAQLAGYAAPQ
jgi:hypothetical protein